MHTQHEEPTLTRLELLGHLAAACRLAMADAPSADGVAFTVEANTDGFTVDCHLFSGGVPTHGWGQ